MNSKIIPIFAIFSILFVAGCTSTSTAPSLSIISPTQGQIISGSSFNAQAAASGVRLVAANGTIIEGEGHIHFFLDNGSYVLSPTGTYVFENVPAGQHSLRAELHRGDHSLYDNITKTVTFTTAAPGTLPPVSTLAVKEFNMTAKRFSFDPSTITVNKGDRVVLHVTSTDVEHGFSLATYDIVETLPAGQTKTITFTADKAGEFNFFCSVFCGSGHADMRGKLIVNP